MPTLTVGGNSFEIMDYYSPSYFPYRSSFYSHPYFQTERLVCRNFLGPNRSSWSWICTN